VSKKDLKGLSRKYIIMTSKTQPGSTRTFQPPKEGVSFPDRSDLARTLGKPMVEASLGASVRNEDFFPFIRHEPAAVPTENGDQNASAKDAMQGQVQSGKGIIIVHGFLRGTYGTYSIETCEGFVFRKSSEKGHGKPTDAEKARFKADITEAARSRPEIAEYLKLHPYLKG
jgi:hypothetical protein